MHYTRRSALQLLVTGAIAVPGNRIDPIGLQLYTVRGPLQDAFETTLERIAGIGYREVEFAGYAGRSPGQVRDALKLCGLTSPSAHVSLTALTSELPRTLETARVIGHRYLVLAYIDEALRRTLDQYRRVADALNTAADHARRAGIRIGYHNHAFEFASLDNRLPYDILLEHAEEQVCFELDLYWISSAGVDPVLYMQRWPGRFPLVHVKDSAGAPEHHMTAVGEGSLDWQRIFALGRNAGIEHYFVEHDAPADPFASIGASYRYLRTLRF